MDTLGERVNRLRLSRGWSQKTLATEAGTSQSAVSMIEKGEFEPSRELLKRLSLVLGVSADLLLFGVNTEDIDRPTTPKEVAA